MLVELVGETGMDEDCDETDEAERDVYREPGPDPTHCLDESNPGAPLDDGVELGSDQKKGASVSQC